MRDGKLYYFEGNGDGTVGPVKTIDISIYNSGWGITDDVGYLANAILHDFNDDGLLDLLVGANHKYQTPITREAVYFWNSGTKESPQFSDANQETFRDRDGNTMAFAGQELTYGDLDGDGVKDIVVSNGTSKQMWYRNRGSNSSPQFDAPINLDAASVGGTNSHVDLIDIDGDSDLDLCISGGAANLLVAQNLLSTSLLTSSTRKHTKPIQYKGRTLFLPTEAVNPSVSIVSSKGAILYENKQCRSGTVSLKQLPSGVYFVTLSHLGIQQTQRIILK